MDERYDYIPILIEEIQKYKLEKYKFPNVVFSTGVEEIIDKFIEKHRNLQEEKPCKKKS